MGRGVVAVEDYLRAEFPGHTVEVLEPSDRDHSRDTRTFKVRDGGRHLLRVTDEALDLDAEGVVRLLGAYRVAQRLRQAGRRNAVLLTTDEVRVEPITP